MERRRSQVFQSSSGTIAVPRKSQVFQSSSVTIAVPRWGPAPDTPSVCFWQLLGVWSSNDLTNLWCRGDSGEVSRASQICEPDMHRAHHWPQLSRSLRCLLEMNLCEYWPVQARLKGPLSSPPTEGLGRVRICRAFKTTDRAEAEHGAERVSSLEFPTVGDWQEEGLNPAVMQPPPSACRRSSLGYGEESTLDGVLSLGRWSSIYRLVKSFATKNVVLFYFWYNFPVRSQA